MSIYYRDDRVTLHHGDCIEVMASLPDASVDAVVTDPPYALGFMGRSWDTFGDVGRGAQARSQRRAEVTPTGEGHSTSAGPYLASGVDSLRAAGLPFQRWCEAWATECLRVLKPGGHLLAFGGTRTWHRLACAVEDAGFEVRDSIAWMYGCLSDDTEILTSEGWVRYDRAKEGQHALAFDTATGALAWQAIQHVHRYPYAGEMVRLRSEHTDQLLTPNHRVVLDEGRSTLHTPYVPSDQDLRRLLADVPGAQPLPVGAEDDVLAGVRGPADLAVKEGQDQASRRAGGPYGAVRDLQDGDVEAGRLAQAERGGVLLEPVQRCAPCGGAGEALPQGQGGLDRRQPGVLPGEDDRAEQPRMEGRRYRVQEARELCRSAVRASAGVGAADGPHGRVHHGAPATDGRPLRVPADQSGSHQPREPRSQGQPTGEPDPLAVEPGAQALRVGEDGGGRLLPSTGVTADVVDYAGVVWCITVPHGAFIARRNGLIFATGNSGFPKSLDVSKAIDKAAGVLEHEGRGFTVAGRTDKNLPNPVVKGYVPPAPATPDAERWQGWGTALKPSHEPVCVAVKPHATSDILVEIGSHLDQLEAACRPSANVAAKSSAPTRAASPEVRTATAPERAATPHADGRARTTPTGGAAGSSARTDTSASASTDETCWSTVTSWRACWAELCELTSTSTTSTATRPTTDLRTLWSSIASLTVTSTPDSPTPRLTESSTATAVDSLFAATVLSWRAIHALSATESATESTPPSRQGAGGSSTAFEPVVVARKPLAGTVAANVTAHGTGALNIDGCRIEHDAKSAAWVDKWAGHGGHPEQPGWGTMGQKFGGSPSGRWPANVVLDESQAEALDEQSGTQRDGTAVNRNKDPKAEKPHEVYGGGWLNGDRPDITHGGQGGASRFFYVAKADATERPRVNGTAHPTVKPLSLMRWLVRLVTPPGGTVLEPFAGSGTTVEACLLEGFHCIAIEKTGEYLPLTVARIYRQRHPVEAVKLAGEELGLFAHIDEEVTG